MEVELVSNVGSFAVIQLTLADSSCQDGYDGKKPHLVVKRVLATMQYFLRLFVRVTFWIEIRRVEPSSLEVSCTTARMETGVSGGVWMMRVLLNVHCARRCRDALGVSSLSAESGGK